MLAEAQMNIINDLVQKHTKEELIWISGYLAGLAKQNVTVPALNGSANGHQPAAAPAAVKTITLLYGTETGNAKRAAATAAHQIKHAGHRVKMVGMDQYKFNDLPKEKDLLVIISTQGDGDPPVSAQKFYDHIHQAPVKLTDTSFAVLALGSTSYPQFCKTGIDVDQQLAKLGAKRIAPVVKCDEDFEEEADQWLKNVLQKIATPAASTQASPTVIKDAAKPVEKGKKFFNATITTNINLNDDGSQKETHHIEFALSEDLDYKPGDAAGVVPLNDEDLIHKILKQANITGQEHIVYKTENYIVFNLLHKKVNILNLPERVVKKYAALVQQEIPETKMDLYDLLRIYPVKNAEQFLEVLQVLDPIAPRLYSIASSPQAHPGELHLMVATDTYHKNSEKKRGLCSSYLNHLPPGNEITMFLHRQKHFHLPPDDKDLIMIGPGTGFAPLRSFIAERDAIGATGRNWLFFGEQHFNSDFYYQTEIQSWKETGVLNKVSLAFSRDQEEKIYVQHRMKEEAAELWEWINNGAYIAICGAKIPMSKDVEQALIDIISKHGNLSHDAATGYLNQLGKDGRYSKDVW
jgi:sulfite reductase (NADPH) flavoprotein alpha-component